MDKKVDEKANKAHAHAGGHGVQVIVRAAEILWALRAHPEGQSIPALVKSVGLARPTVHRLVGTLQSVGFVSRTAGGQVRLGAALSILGAAANNELVAEVHSHLQALSRSVNESILLATFDGEVVTCIDFVASPQSLQAVAQMGMPLPIHCTAIGKSLLPELSRDEFISLVPEELQTRTENTISTRELLLKEVERIREVGVAFDREEYEMGVCGLGASISCGDRGLRAAIGILMPSLRFYGNEERLASELVTTRDVILGQLTTSRGVEKLQSPRT